MLVVVDFWTARQSTNLAFLLSADGGFGSRADNRCVATFSSAGLPAANARSNAGQ
jgi:hypothetical protein